MRARPIIFVSAVSRELKTARQLVCNSLHFLGFEPEYQEIFGAEQGDLRAMLRKKIDGCQGVVQLVGRRYGAEPPVHDGPFGRVSYTQYEALYARQQGKKVWYLLVGDDFPVDTHDPKPAELPESTTSDLKPDKVPLKAESQELQDLQKVYLEKLLSDSHLYHSFDSHEALESIVLKLRNDLAVLRRNVKQWAAAVVALLMLLTVAIVWGGHRLGRMNQQVAKMDEQMTQMAALLGRDSPPDPTAADWARTGQASADGAHYQSAAYQQKSSGLIAGTPFHPQLALAIFGLSQGATNWVPLGPASSLRSGEHFFIRAETFTPGFLYLFEVDSTGELQWLFPTNPTSDFSFGNNPLPPGVAVSLPPDTRQAFALDDHVGDERVYAIFSASRWEKLEAALKLAGGTNEVARHEVEALLASGDSMASRAKGIAREENVAVAKDVRQSTSANDEAFPVDLPPQSVEANGHWLLEIQQFRHLGQALAHAP